MLMNGLISRSYQICESYLQAIEAEIKCTICLDVYKDPIETNCGHFFCKECFLNYLKANVKMKCNCPLCKTSVNKREFRDATKLATLSLLVRGMMDNSLVVETYDGKSRGSQSLGGQQTKKRKFNQITTDREVVRLPTFQYPLMQTENDRTTAVTSTTATVTTEIVASNVLVQNRVNLTKEEHKNEEDDPERTPTRSTIINTRSDLLETVKASRSLPYEEELPILDKISIEKPQSRQLSIPKQEKRIINMITSNLSKNLMDDVDKFCKLYKGRNYKEFCDNITHIIVYPNQDRGNVIQAKRTLKYLHGLIQGCWIVSYRWIVDSIIEDTVLNEEEYEVTSDGYGIGAPQTCRLKGGLQTLFEGLNFALDEIHTHEAAMKKAELCKLLTRAGGIVVKSPAKTAKNLYNIQILGVDENSQDYSKKKPSIKKVCYATCFVSHRWILDSISSYQILEPSIYLV